MSYCTLADVKAYEGIDSGNTSQDSTLTSLMVSAQALIDSSCNRTFEAAADTTRRLDCPLPDSDDVRCLPLDGDLCQITTVTNGDGATVGASNYVTQPRNLTPWYAIELKRTSDTAWTYGDDGPEQAIAITGRWAYSITAPAAIKHACIRLTSWLFRQKDNQAELDRLVVSPDGMVLMPGTLPKDVRDILDRYRRL